MEKRSHHRGRPLAIQVVQEVPNLYQSSSSSEDNKPDDDFYAAWDRFLAKSPGHMSSTSTLARRVKQTEIAAHKVSNGLKMHESPAKSYEEAKAECKAKVRAIVTECRRLNQKYIDRRFDLENDEFDCIHPLGDSSDEDDPTPSAVKRIEAIFENPKFNEEFACAADVMQGQLGDCWLLAAIMSLAAKPGLIKRLCVDRDEQVGVYGFVFFRDGGWVLEVIDDRLFLHVSDGEDLFVGRYVDTSNHRKQEVSTATNSYDINKLRENLQKGGEALFFARCKSQSDTWLPLIEKAYAKVHGDYGSIDGGDTSEGIEDLTGGVSVSLKPSQILDKQRFWEEMKNANDTYIFAGGAQHYERGGRSGQHAYAVLQVAEHDDLKLLKLRDPWGKHQDDGPWMHKFTGWSSELVDKLGHDFKDPGAFWMTYENFLRHFYIIDRTRIFTDDWKVTQQWTSVNVPPIGEYLDTHFVMTLTEAGAVVLVLCQPDTRYFRGLEGRYDYSLHFRVYSTTDPHTYIARSMHGSGCLPRALRSVTADLHLPAGPYRILCKISPERFATRTAAGHVVETFSHRREKLLHTGRNFDLAHTKGNQRSLEEANKQQAKEDRKRKRSEKAARQRRLRQLGKLREERRKERIAGEKARRRDAIFWREVQERAARKGVAVPAGMQMPMLTVAGYAGATDPEAEIGDDDFEWDQDVDGSACGSSGNDSDDDDRDRDVYADDTWNAVCVFGLRVYSQHGDASIKVAEGGSHASEDQSREGDQGPNGGEKTKNDQGKDDITENKESDIQKKQIREENDESHATPTEALPKDSDTDSLIVKKNGQEEGTTIIESECEICQAPKVEESVGPDGSGSGDHGQPTSGVDEIQIGNTQVGAPTSSETIGGANGDQ